MSARLVRLADGRRRGGEERARMRLEEHGHLLRQSLQVLAELAVDSLVRRAELRLAILVANG